MKETKTDRKSKQWRKKRKERRKENKKERKKKRKKEWKKGSRKTKERKKTEKERKKERQTDRKINKGSHIWSTYIYGITPNSVTNSCTKNVISYLCNNLILIEESIKKKKKDKRSKNSGKSINHVDGILLKFYSLTLQLATFYTKCEIRCR